MTKGHEPDCQQAKAYYFDFLNGDKSSPWSEHIAGCKRCQEEVRRLETEMGQKKSSDDALPRTLGLHHRNLSQWIDCDAVKPFMASLANSGLSMGTRTPVTVHIAQCRQCQDDLSAIAKMELSDVQRTEATRILAGETSQANHLNQQATTKISAIRNRHVSGIITCMEVDSEGEIHIQTKYLSQSVSAAHGRRRQFIGKFAAVAAIMLVVCLVLFRTATVSGVSLQTIYQAMNSVMNCQVQFYVLEQKDPIQTIIFSKELKMVVMQQQNESFLLDMQQHKIFYAHQESKSVSKELEQNLWSTINQIGFGLLPFETINQLPAGYVWKQRTDLSAETPYKIYDLTWKESSDAGMVVEKTWRGFLQNDTSLPVQIQWFEKHPNQTEKMVMKAVIQYPDTASVRKDMEASSFYFLFQGDQVK